ncbi:MAG: DNA repair protein RadC [Bacteroidota bacterium]|jgi:DNA repair protein RadC
MSEYSQEKSLNIKQWAEEDRPREKLILKGRQALTDAELLAIIIGSGTPKESAVELSKKILSLANNNLFLLGNLTLEDLKKVKGIGEAKAISIAAALEIGRRRKESEPPKKLKIDSSKSAYEYIYQDLSDLPHEEFYVVYLKRSNEVIEKMSLSKGGLAGTVVDVRIILKRAIELQASALVLFHNHPSGNLKPSGADLDITKKIIEAGKFMDISVLDHLIIGHNKYLSLRDENLI